MTTLMAAIIVAVLIVLLTILLWKIMSGTEEEASRMRCKTSVQAYAKMNSVPIGSSEAETTAIKCPTTYAELEAGDPAEMKQEIADMMVECWDNFGRGKLRLFRASDEKFCVICSVFQFEDRTEQLSGLPSYLMTEKAPIRVDGKYPTYHEFLTGVQTNDRFVDEARGNIDADYLDGSQRYAVMFTYYKRNYLSRLQGATIGMAVGGMIGRVTGLGRVRCMILGGIVGALATGRGVGGGTTTSGIDWDAQVILAEYDAEYLQQLGCDSLPVSQIDQEFGGPILERR